LCTYLYKPTPGFLSSIKLAWERKLVSDTCFFEQFHGFLDEIAIHDQG